MKLPKIDMKNPAHLIGVGFGLLAIYALKALLVFIAIGFFIYAVAITYKGDKDVPKSTGCNK